LPERLRLLLDTRKGLCQRRDGDPTFLAKVRQLEVEICDLTGVRHAVAVNSGTSALWLIMAGLGIGPGDEVIVPGFTFIASISAIVHVRARPVLAEIDRSFNLDPTDVEAKITPARAPSSPSTCSAIRRDCPSSTRLPRSTGCG
jgi:dTDP-4-amino-4,6-dideoxygalactose transaminase